VNPVDLRAPVHGSVIAIEVQPGQQVAAGTVLLLIESMKMEVPVEAPFHAEVLAVTVAVGEVTTEDLPLLRLRPLANAPAGAAPAARQRRPARARTCCACSSAAPCWSDAARPEAMARRHASGLRSARENVTDLLDAGSFTDTAPSRWPRSAAGAAWTTCSATHRPTA
jgi:pyruvate/2-oxoglutarate dehydrogenase complex dihydrolipoamide acyltransferase (E2) component